jgi:hypothetical protein
LQNFIDESGLVTTQFYPNWLCTNGGERLVSLIGGERLVSLRLNE